VWAYGVMPADADGLRATLAEAPRRYVGAINARMRWTGTTVTVLFLMNGSSWNERDGEAFLHRRKLEQGGGSL
jgi:hypothetical protein